MSKTSARHRALQEFLSARGYATIEELARHFEVTPQTVRKDINALAEEGKVQRFHGGAGMVSGSENIVYDERKGICQEEKRRIGALLATHIPDGVSVCINIGTTTEEAARALLEHKNLRVVTNSINVASRFPRNSSFDVPAARCGTGTTASSGPAPSVLSASSGWTTASSAFPALTRRATCLITTTAKSPWPVPSSNVPAACSS